MRKGGIILNIQKLIDDYAQWLKNEILKDYVNNCGEND